jgi:hypothetical protein
MINRDGGIRPALMMAGSIEGSEKKSACAVIDCQTVDLQGLDQGPAKEEIKQLRIGLDFFGRRLPQTGVKAHHFQNSVFGLAARAGRDREQFICPLAQLGMIADALMVFDQFPQPRHIAQKILATQAFFGVERFHLSCVPAFQQPALHGPMGIYPTAVMFLIEMDTGPAPAGTLDLDDFGGGRQQTAANIVMHPFPGANGKKVGQADGSFFDQGPVCGVQAGSAFAAASAAAQAFFLNVRVFRHGSQSFPRPREFKAKEPVSKRPILADLCVGLKFQSSRYANTPCIPAVEIFARLDLGQTETF